MRWYVSLGNVPGSQPREQIWCHSWDMASKEDWYGFGSSSSSSWMGWWWGVVVSLEESSVLRERVVVVDDEDVTFSAQEAVV